MYCSLRVCNKCVENFVLTVMKITVGDVSACSTSKLIRAALDGSYV